jgi:alkanesulfonate monooxygenase SsuD/methylene tetrahydromethanopterin reductase-like flavin-dependent oxidoreductase (luciferase family)
VEWGTGESSAALELEGFAVPLSDKRAMWQECTAAAADMLAMTPYPGLDGQYVKMPCRNVLPKPLQKPHPPLWVACSRRETIHMAARHGVGALTFAFVDPAEASKWVGEYYDILKRECTPIGHSINPNIAMVTGFSCHEDQATAVARGLPGFQFFGYALAHHYIFGEHQPGITDIWQKFQAWTPPPDNGQHACIGTPAHIRKQLRTFADAGVDQVIFIQQGGRNQHAHICESLELFAREVMPELKAGEAERERKKLDELGPYLEAAMARKQWRTPLDAQSTPVVKSYGRRVIAEPEQAEEDPAAVFRAATGVAKR